MNPLEQHEVDEHEPAVAAEEVEAPQQEPAEPEAPEIDPEVLETARKYGWKGPDEWQGAPPKKGFMRPDEYVELPQIQARMLRDDLAEERKAREALQRETADKLARMDRMYEEAAKRRAEQHKAEVARIRTEMRQAAADGDVERYGALEKQQEALGPVPQQQEPQADPEVATINKWVSSLPADHWWRQDAVLRTVSGSLYDEAGAKGVMGADAKIAYVERRIREDFPHKFPGGEKPKQRVAKVDGGGLALGGPKRPSERLPSDVMAIAKRDVADGLYPDLDAWAKFYLENEGNV